MPQIYKINIEKLSIWYLPWHFLEIKYNKASSLFFQVSTSSIKQKDEVRWASKGYTTNATITSPTFSKALLETREMKSYKI